MIRINLLVPAGRGDARSREPRPRAVWLGFTSIAAAALVSGLAWWSVRADATRLDRGAVVLEGELATVRAAAREAEALLSRKQALADRLTTIAKDSAARSAPVRVLAAVGESVPDDISLTAIRQRGSQFEIDGRAASLASVMEFAERIHVAGVLTTPVEIVSTSAETRERTTFVRFSLRLD
jgi:Tfp pilus assembly protein PilN